MSDRGYIRKSGEAMAQRRLNKSLVVGLVVGLMVISTVAAILLLMTVRDPGKVAAPLLRIAEEAYRAGNYEAAMRAYTQAFNRTRDVTWLVAQGEAAKDSGDALGAMRIWDRAVSEDPSLITAHEARIRLRLELAAMYGTAQQNAALRGVADALLRQSPDHPLGHFGRGVALTGLAHEQPENMAEGLAEMEKAHELAPADREMATSMARAYQITSQNRLNEKKPKEAAEYRKRAEDVFRRMIKADPESAEAYLSFATFLMGRLYSEKGLAQLAKKKFDAATEAAALKEIDENLLHAEKLDPKSPELGMHRAQYWRMAEKPEKVIEEYERVIAAVPDYLDAYSQLATRYRAEQKPEESLKALEGGLSQDVDLLGYKGNLNKRKRFQMLCTACEIALAQAAAEPEKREAHVERAGKYYDRAVAEKGATGPRIRLVEGQLCEARRQYREAQQAYEAANNRLAWGGTSGFYKVRALLRLARLYLQRLKAPGEAVKLLNSVLERQHANFSARLMRAEAYLTMNKPSEAIDDVKRVLAAGKELSDDHQYVREARKLAMRGYAMLGKPEEVRKLQDKLGGETPAAKLREAFVYQLEKKNDKAAEIYKALLKEDPANRRLLARAVGFLVSIDKRDDAKKLLSAAVAKKPDDPVFERMSLLLDEKLSDEQRDERLLGLIKETDDAFAREVSLYQYYIRRNKPKEALSHLEAARKTKPDSRPLLDAELGIALQQKDWERAERCWGEAARLNLDGVEGRFVQGRIALVKGGLEKQEADKLAAKDLAKSQERRKKAKALLAEAAKHLREGIAIYGKSSQAHYWLGGAEEGLGNLVDARDAYTMAAELDPTNGNAHRALAKLGKTYGNVADVEGHLKEATRLASKDPEGLPRDPWLRLQVENEREQADPRSAIKRREEARKKDPKGIYNLMRLALLYERVEDKAKANTCVEDALKAEPKNLALAWDVSQFYTRNDQLAKADKLLRDLVKQVTSDEKTRAQVMVARHNANIVRRHARGIKRYAQDVLLGAQQAADRAYAVAAQLPNTPPQVFVEAATFCIETRRERGAVEWLRKALEVVNEKSYEAQIRRRLIGVLLRTRPIPVDAGKEVTDYVKTFPDDPRGSQFRGKLCAAQGKLDMAVEEYTAYLDQITRQGKGPTRAALMAEGYFLRGSQYFKLAQATRTDRDKHLRLAIEDLRAAKTYAPKGGRRLTYRVALAQANRLKGQPDEAIQELRAVLSENPKARGPALALVRVYGGLKRWGDQEALIRQQMNLFADDVTWPYLLGKQFVERSRHADAIAPLKKACELLEYKKAGNGPEQPLILLLRCLSKTGRHKEVVDIVTTKLGTEDKTSDALAHYAEALAATDKKADALAAFIQAVGAARSFKSYSRVAQQLARSFGGLEQAIQAVRAEHEKAGAKGEIPAMLLSSLLAFDKKPGDALALVTQAVAAAKDPVRKAICLASQGILLYGQGEKQKAEQVYMEALRNKGDELTVLNNLAFVLAEDLKRPQEALSYADRAFRLSPGDPYVLDTLGWCLFLAGRSQDAMGVLLETIDRDPRLLDTHLHLARVYAKEGQKSEAEGVLRGALERADEQDDQASKDNVLALMKELGIQP